MATKSWSGHITFGMLSIPVNLYIAARSESVSFNQLHATCGNRMKQSLCCPACDRAVSRDEIAKGYEYEKDTYVTFSPDEIAAMAPKSGKIMEILEFVNESDVDPLYFDASFFLQPDAAGVKAYALLSAAMNQSGRLGVARVTMHNREHIVLVRPTKNGLTLHTMFFQDEVRSRDAIVAPELNDAEVEMATALIDSMATSFEPAKYTDEFKTGLQAMIQAKLSGTETPKPAAAPKAPVVDLMAALKASLAARGKVAA